METEVKREELWQGRKAQLQINKQTKKPNNNKTKHKYKKQALKHSDHNLFSIPQTLKLHMPIVLLKKKHAFSPW